MIRTMVSLIDEERAIHVQVHDALVDIALAALSAEPVMIDELKAAMGRYVEPPVVEYFFEQCEEGLASRCTDGGHLIIDFTRVSSSTAHALWRCRAWVVYSPATNERHSKPGCRIGFPSSGR